MIARVELNYGYREKMAALAEDPAKLHIIRGIFGAQMPADDQWSLTYMWPSEIVIDMTTDGPNLIALGIDFTVKAFKGTMSMSQVTGLAVPADSREVKVIIQVPHIGLLTIDEVDVLDNTCTDILQARLDAGWRILCVCPPNAQRRPDYIIGRTKERS